MGAPIAAEGSRASTIERLATGAYAGALLAGVATIAAAASAPSAAVLGGAFAVAFLVGFLSGWTIAARDRRLPARFGRTVRRRLLLLAPAVPFAALTVASWVAPIGDAVATVALWSTAAVLVAGHVLARVAQARYVDAVTEDDPIATWEWNLPASPRLDVVVAVLWLLLAGGNAATGDWTAAAVWTTLGLLWLSSRVAEGRWGIGPGGSRPEIRVHEAGLVKRRPYTRSLVPWESIDHVRLRDDELVLDRGLFDVRFDRDELEEPEAALAAIERRVQRVDSGGRVANGD